MLGFALDALARPIERVLAIGCHADDIEIGCGGTLIALTRARPGLAITWVVLAAPGERAGEARASAGGVSRGRGRIGRSDSRVSRRLPPVLRR